MTGFNLPPGVNEDSIPEPMRLGICACGHSVHDHHLDDERDEVTFCLAIKNKSCKCLMYTYDRQFDDFDTQQQSDEDTPEHIREANS